MPGNNKNTRKSKKEYEEIRRAPYEYYIKHYGRMTRTELSKKNGYLYRCLRANGDIDKICWIVKRRGKRRDVSEIKRNPYEYYLKYYKGIKRTELQKKDGCLYKYLTKYGDIEKLPLSKGGRRRADIDEVKKDPYAYYMRHYKGSGRSEIQKKDITLYKYLRLSKDIEKIPLLPKATKKRREENDEIYRDPWGYYSKYYKGMSRGELQKKNNTLYHYLRRSGDLEKIERVQLERVDIEEVKKDPYAYYLKHYDGMKRTELNKEDGTVYRYLKANGDIEKIEKVYKKRVDIEEVKKDPYAYYLKHYKGMSRAELNKENYLVYRYLKANGDIEQVERVYKKRVDIEEIREDPYGYYLKHYEGLSRTELNTKDSTLYRYLKANGDLEKIKTQKRGKKKR